ncbi:hypothetical protein [Psychrobacillus phage Spoks]|nr:hypothetical protein [Psychrobacillus phage Spoks]
MVIIPSALPTKIHWISENGKWKIVAKVDEELFSSLVVQKLNKYGKWINEYSRKQYPTYLKDKISEFETAIRKFKRELR